MIIKDEEKIQKAGTVCDEDHKREGKWGSVFVKDLWYKWKSVAASPNCLIWRIVRQLWMNRDVYLRKFGILKEIIYIVKCWLTYISSDCGYNWKSAVTSPKCLIWRIVRQSTCWMNRDVDLRIFGI